MNAGTIKDDYIRHERGEWAATLWMMLMSGPALLCYGRPEKPLHLLGILSFICLLAGILSYGGHFLRKFRLAHLHPELVRQAEDERFRLNLLKAQSWGFRVGSGAVLAGFILSRRFPGLLTPMGLWALLAAGLLACAAAFLWLEWEKD